MFNDSIFPSLCEQITFPSTLAIIGSGNTKPPLEWEGIPSIRLNQETLHPIDKYPFLPLFGIITTRQFLGRCSKIRRQYKKNKPYLWCFDTHRIGVENELLEKKYFRIGVKWENNTYPDYLGDYLSKTRKEGPTPHCKYSTGFYSLVFAVLSQARRLYIAGFDAYKQQKTYYHVDQERVWDTKRHNLNYEWLCMENVFEHLRTQGVKVTIQKDLNE